MTRAVSRPAVLVVLAGLLATLPGSALISTVYRGGWPRDWPVDLEPLRERATTIMADPTPRLNVYEIPFDSQEEFEAVWPSIQDVKSPGATLRLLSPGAARGAARGANDGPLVRLLAPSGRVSFGPEAGGLTEDKATHEQMVELVREGKALRCDYPWPESAYLENGDLAEYVELGEVDGKLTWVPVEYDKEDPFHVLNRARVDVELVVDGEVIDLNRIHLPDNTRVIDEREL